MVRASVKPELESALLVHSAKLWHRKLGHIGQLPLQKLFNENLIGELGRRVDKSKEEVCTGCARYTYEFRRQGPV